MKLPAIKADKYDHLSKTELRDKLVQHDSRKTQGEFMSKLTEHKMLRMASGVGAAFLTGVLYEKKPGLESLMGTPASFDHLLAVGGAFAAFLTDDEEVASASEGIANVGLSHLFRSMGRKVGGVSLS